MQWIREYTPEPTHQNLYRKALIITVAGNILLAVSKGLVAYFSGSVAIFADAANSVSDVVYSLLMVVGLWFALQPRIFLILRDTAVLNHWLGWWLPFRCVLPV